MAAYASYVPSSTCDVYTGTPDVSLASPGRSLGVGETRAGPPSRDTAASPRLPRDVPRLLCVVRNNVVHSSASK